MKGKSKMSNAEKIRELAKKHGGLTSVTPAHVMKATGLPMGKAVTILGVMRYHATRKASGKPYTRRKPKGITSPAAMKTNGHANGHLNGTNAFWERAVGKDVARRQTEIAASKEENRLAKHESELMLLATLIGPARAAFIVEELYQRLLGEVTAKRAAS